LALRSTSGESRHVELINGEAVVSATLESGGSCLVTAGLGQIVARNAKFNVRRDSSRQVRGVCLDGRLEVPATLQMVGLGANERVAYDRDGIGRKEPVDAEAVTAWQQGRLVFRRAPLSEVIAEVNRYRPGLIVLTNDALSSRLVDASFKLDRLDTVIAYL